MIQQGRVFKLKARRADGRPLWAYRYRLDGRVGAAAGGRLREPRGGGGGAANPGVELQVHGSRA